MSPIRCRKNLATLTVDERKKLRNAFLRLKELGRYDKYVAMHGFVSNLGHSGPAFLPWHRVFIHRLEQELQDIDPDVTLPYWDFTSSNASGGDSLIWFDEAAAATEDEKFLGANGTVTLEWTALDGVTQESWTIERTNFGLTETPVDPSSVEGDLTRDDYDFNTSNEFRRDLEAGAHGSAHVWLGIPGDQDDFATAVNDPFFFFLHCNVDRIWAQWQQKKKAEWLQANPGMDYPAGQPAIDYYWDESDAAHNWAPPPAGDGPASAVPNRHNLDDVMWPWDGTETPTGGAASAFSPWKDGMPEVYTPRQTLDYTTFGYIYDDDPPIVTLDTPSITFNDVPEGEETARAAVFKVLSCGPVTLEVISGPTVTSAPAGPPDTMFTLPFGTSVIEVPEGEVGEFDARVWVVFQGTNAGDMATGEITIRCVETDEEWTIPITANTIARPTVAAVLALDRSNSMNFDSGVDGLKRIDLLHYSAPAFVDVIQEGNAVGAVAFDHDPHDVTPVTGPLGPPGPLDVDRGAVQTAILNHMPNPSGNTAIGDGLERAHQQLNPVSGYDVKATIVLTDGKETAAKYISDVTDDINERVYAIGLGTADQVDPVALSALTNDTGGYLLMTGELDLDDQFRLSKYYLQILAGVTNEDIVLDPEGTLKLGEEHRIPFQITEADVSTDVILLAPAPQAFRMYVETPNGDLIDPGIASATPGVLYHAGQRTVLYRMTLPAPVGSSEAGSGRWHAVLKADEKHYRRYINSLENDLEAFRRVNAHGIPYSLNVHAFSNVRMRGRVLQTSNEPGATLTLRAVLTESSLPVTNRARVYAELERPDTTTAEVDLVEVEPGIYEAEHIAAQPGVYRYRLLATGRTRRGSRFTREHLLTGAVWRGGDKVPPTSKDDDSAEKERLCKLLAHLLDERAFGRLLKEQKVDVAYVEDCIRMYCERPRRIQASDVLRLNPELARMLEEPRVANVMTQLLGAIDAGGTQGNGEG